MWLASASQFRAYDKYIIDNYNESIERMILKAAKTLYPYVAREEHVVILAGKGNNGADGLALSCLLQNMKQDVTVFVMAKKQALSQGATFYLEKAIALEVPVYYLSDSKDYSYHMFMEKMDNASVIVDAIFGTGLNSAPSGIEKIVIHAINQQQNTPVLAIDVPSGLNADNGTIYNEAVQAHITVSFVAMKLGYLNPDASHYTGEIHIEDLGYDSKALQAVGFSHYLEPEKIWPLLKQRKYDGYKGSYGILTCFTGSKIYPGAAMIASGAALKTGTGMVKVASDQTVLDKVVLKHPEIVCVEPSLSVKEIIENSSAILFGCGKGFTEKTTKQLEELLATAKVPVLLDADGINCISEHLTWLEEANCPIIMTPHIGEMKRLLKNEAEQDSTLGAIKFALKYHTIIVLKGPHTMITDGKISVRIPSGDKAMATAGMGDALAGIIASFLAQGYAYFDACILGTYLHGLAGQTLAKTAYTAFASDIIALLPQLMFEISNK